MSTYEAITAKLGDHVVAAVERMQEVQVDALNALSSAVSEVTPAVDAGPIRPNPREIAEANLALAERLLEAQRRYTFAVLDALSPITEQVSANVESPRKATSTKK